MIPSDRTSADPPASSLTAALSPGRGRVGWQYVDPGGPRASPLLGRRPLLNEPPPPSWSATGRKTRSRPGWVVIGAIVVFGLGLAGPTRGVSVLLGLGVLGWLLWPSLVSEVGSPGGRRADEAWEQAKARAADEFAVAEQEWLRQIELHDAQELARLETAVRWQPVDLDDSIQRLDVVGGLPGGWRKLVATIGMGLLSQGRPLLVVDLSGDDVASGLAELAQDATVVRSVALPRQGDVLDLLAELSPEAMAELLAEAVDSLRGGGDRVAKAVDAEILGEVARRLETPLTFSRLLAGLRVLQRNLEQEDQLSLSEVAALSRDLDAIVMGEREAEQVRVLAITIRRLAAAHAGGATAESLGDLWLQPGLTVVGSEDASTATKEATDRLLFHVLLQRLRVTPAAEGAAVVVIAPDELGAEALEALAQYARRRGVLLLYVLRYFRDGTRRLVGGDGSATMFMRLGNGEEAKAAAEHIGREHKFVLAQISRQQNVSDTLGGSEGEGTTTTVGLTDTSGASSSGMTGSSNVSQSFSQSISQSSQTMRSWSRTTSTSGGETQQRVHEFFVDDRELKELPETGFIFVEGRTGSVRALAGDCNPAIALLESPAAAPVLASG